MDDQILSIWYQPSSPGVQECVAIEVTGKQKRFVRYWPLHEEPHYFEYGWRVHPTAICVWRRSELLNEGTIREASRSYETGTESCH